MRRMAARVASLDEKDWGDEEDFDPVEAILDGASGLDAEDVSLNQPVLPPGRSLEPGTYTFYKGGEVDADQPGFVTDDREHASGWGEVHEVIVECDGGARTGWTYVHDWDGDPQLVPPGPECSKVTEDGWLVLKRPKSIRKL